MNPLLAVLVVILALQAIAFVIAIVARYWVLRSESFELHGIDVARATDLVAVYVEGVHDHRFGFPTGVFEIDAARTSPGRVLAREINFSGSAGMGPIRFGLRLPLLGLAAGLAIGDGADDAGGCAVGMLGGMIGVTLGVMAALVLIVPFAFLAIVEVILRTLMRGEITATIDKVPEEDATVRVRFELRGLSAFGVEHQLRRGMTPPNPDGPDAPAPVAAAPSGQPLGRFDRLNTIYLAAASVGLIVSVAAIVAIGNTQSDGYSTAAYGYESSSYEEEGEYGEESYEEESYEEESYEEESYGEEEEGYGEEENEYEESYEEEGYEEEEGEESAPATRYEAARLMYLRYWSEIDAGNYGAAYDVYYPTFATQEGVSKSEFIAAEYEYLPHVGLEHISLEPSSRQPTSPNELWLYAEIPIRDSTGELAGQCRLFYGDLRMFHANGRWYYRPGTAFGRSPSFGHDGGGIRVLPSYSDRCS
jgi:hypothetical protein